MKYDQGIMNFFWMGKLCMDQNKIECFLLFYKLHLLVLKFLFFMKIIGVTLCFAAVVF